MADEPEPDSPDEQTNYPDEEDDPLFWHRFERLMDGGEGFPADEALCLAALQRVDTVEALELLKKVRAKGLDPEVASHILV
jgi:hypothetical protein